MSYDSIKVDDPDDLENGWLYAKDWNEFVAAFKSLLSAFNTHTHDLLYAAIDHIHTGYASSTHTHSESDINNLSTDLSKIKISSNDTTADYLLNKLSAGENITLIESDDGGNEKIVISSSGGGPGELSWGLITGDLGDQTDLSTVLSNKSDTGHNHDTSYLGLDAKAADSDKLDGYEAIEFQRTTSSDLTLYVDKAATGTGDGLSWANACTTRQAAIDLIPYIVKHTIVIYVRASGTYTEPITIKKHVVSGSGTITIRGEYYWYNAVVSPGSGTGKFNANASDTGIQAGDSVYLSKWSGTHLNTNMSDALLDTVASVSGIEITLTVNAGVAFDATWHYVIVRTKVDTSGTNAHSITGYGATNSVSIIGFDITGHTSKNGIYGVVSQIGANYCIIRNCYVGVYAVNRSYLPLNLVAISNCTVGIIGESFSYPLINTTYIVGSTKTGTYGIITYSTTHGIITSCLVDNVGMGLLASTKSGLIVTYTTLGKTAGGVTSGITESSLGIISYSGTNNATYPVNYGGTTRVSSNDITIGYLNGKLVAGTNIVLTENSDGGNETLTIAAPLDSDLSAIAALTGTYGLLKKTAENTWSIDTNSYLTAITKAMVENVLIGEISSHTHAYQTADATLTALAGLTTGADLLPYFNGIDSALTTSLTSAARSLLDDPTVAAMLITLGLTATATELNYTDGVTGAIQTQLDTKSPIANPTFTGIPAAPSATPGTDTTQLATTEWVNDEIGYKAAAIKSNSYLPTSCGQMSVSASYYINWTDRILLIGNGSGSHYSTQGVFQINKPTEGSTITGVGGASNKLVTSDGVPLESHEALYYILPIGSIYLTIQENFRVVGYTSSLVIPEHWFKIAQRDYDGAHIIWYNGLRVPPGFSIDSWSYNAYNAAIASAVPWSGVSSKPTTLSGYGITDAAASGHGHIQSDITNLVSDLALKSPLANPTFTGVPAAPSATPGTDTTQLATTEFVNDEISHRAGVLKASGGVAIETDATISNPSGYVKWSNYFYIYAGFGNQAGTSGKFTISFPAVSTVITGVGGASNATVDATGIPIAGDSALYYILPVGTTGISIDTNFRLVKLNSALVIPENWMFICTKDDYSGKYRWFNGMVLAAGESVSLISYDSNRAQVAPWSGITSKPTTIDGYGITDPARRNAIINGDFKIWQRGTSFPSSATGHVYAADRWTIYRTDLVTGLTATQQASGSPGSRYCMRLQRTASDTSTKDLNLMQVLTTENSIPLQGKKVTLSFKARLSAGASGTAVNIGIYSGTGTDQHPSGTWTGLATVVSGSVTPTTSWTTHSLTSSAVVASSVTQLYFTISYTPVGTAGASDYIEITDVQIESGSAATDFIRRTYEEVLKDCTYYFRRWSTVGYSGMFGAGCAIDTSHIYINCMFPNTMRTTPTVTLSSGTHWWLRVGATGIVPTAMSVTSITPEACLIIAVNTTNPFTAGNGGVLAGRGSSPEEYIDISAELSA